MVVLSTADNVDGGFVESYGMLADKDSGIRQRRLSRIHCQVVCMADVCRVQPVGGNRVCRKRVVRGFLGR